MKMTIEEKKVYLNEIFRKGIGANRFSTQKEWAELLEIDRTGLSAALNGSERFLTDSLIRKVKMWARVNGLEDYPEKPVEREPDNTVKELLSAVRDMSATIRSQQETIALLAGLQKQLLKNK